MRWRLVAGASLALLVVLALGADETRRPAAAPRQRAVVVAGVRLYPLPRRVVEICRSAQARSRITILCPSRLPRPVRDEAGASAPPLNPITAFDWGDGVDISYSAETGWPRLDGPERMFHLQVIEQEQPLPPSTRPARLGGKTGRLARATSRHYADETYFANHLRFFWTERGARYAATLHYFGPRTGRLLGWLVANLRPARALRRRAAGDGERVKTFPAPVPGPVSVAFGRGRLWVAGQGDRSISASWLAELDPGSGRVAGRRIRIARGGGTTALVVGDRRDAPVWVVLRGAPGRRGLQRVAPGARRPSETIDLRPELVAIARSRAARWLADYGGWPRARRYRGGSILRTDAAGRRVVLRIPVGRAPADVAVGSGSLWVTNNLDGTVSRIDMSSNRVAAVVRAGARPTGLAAGAGAVWVADFAGAAIRRIDPATNSVVARIPVDPGPRGVAVGEGCVWVTSELTDTLTRIDPHTNRVVERLPVGAGPVDVTVGGGYVWTADADDRAVTRIAP